MAAIQNFLGLVDDAAKFIAKNGDDIAKTVASASDDVAKTVSIFGDDAAKGVTSCIKGAGLGVRKSIIPQNLQGLKYASDAIGDTVEVVTKSKADEAIAKVKTFVGPDGLKYEDFALKDDSFWLNMWKRHIYDNFSRGSKELDRLSDEIKKCFAPENIQRIDGLKNLSTEEIEAINKFSFKNQLIAVLTGHKPAYFESFGDITVDFAKALKGTKYADEITALTDAAGRSCLLRNKQVKEIISRNKEIYCRELGIDMATSVDDIYKKLITSISSGSMTSDSPLAFGLTLGYPKLDSILYTIKNLDKTAAYNLNLLKYDGAPKQCLELREALINALHSSISPVKDYSKECLSDLEDLIRKSDFRVNFDLDEMPISSFHRHVLDSPDLQRIKELEKDFIKNFRMEQLIS